MRDGRRVCGASIAPDDQRAPERRRTAAERTRTSRADPPLLRNTRRDGEKLGLVEGRDVGFAKGFEVGQEMGFYAGCHAVWARCVREDPECFSERAKKGIASFGAALESFPIDDPLNEEILEILNTVRGKFKTVVALLGMHHEYNPATSFGLSF